MHLSISVAISSLHCALALLLPALFRVAPYHPCSIARPFRLEQILHACDADVVMLSGLGRRATSGREAVVMTVAGFWGLVLGNGCSAFSNRSAGVGLFFKDAILRDRLVEINFPQADLQGTAGLFEAWNAAGRHILDFFHNSEVIEEFRQLDPAVLRVAFWTENEISNAHLFGNEA